VLTAAAAILIGFTGLTLALTLIQLRSNQSATQLSITALLGVLFLGLTTAGLYSLVHAQELRIGVICGSLIILVKILTTAYQRTRYSAASS
jgi:hypothetical protein